MKDGDKTQVFEILDVPVLKMKVKKMTVKPGLRKSVCITQRGLYIRDVNRCFIFLQLESICVKIFKNEKDQKWTLGSERNQQNYGCEYR